MLAEDGLDATIYLTGRTLMKKLVLTTVAACLSMAFTAAYADTNTSKDPLRVAQAASSDTATPKKRAAPEPSGMSEAGPSSKAPSADAKRKERPAKESKRKTPDAGTQATDVGPVGSAPSTDAKTKTRAERETRTKRPDAKGAGEVDSAKESGKK